jgi:tRNA wybutosine-synthesizing protein 1
METPVPSPIVDALKRQKYHFVGRHSAVKRCRWFHETLVHNRPCYKQKFYGIKTHQCIQMTPAAYHCTQSCLFCWRAQSGDLQASWDEARTSTWDSPEEIVEKSINAQHALLTGYSGNPKTDKQKYKEALTPKHVAISLAGEPTLYEPLGDLIRLFHRKGFTTFLVSNGTLSSVLAKLIEEPTQLYISVCAPDEETYRRVCRPHVSQGWEKVNETLSLLSSFRCPTVIRITSVRGLNMKNPRGYARLIKKTEPTYVEAKAYMHVGFSRLRLDYEAMPSHSDMREFSAHIANETGFNLIDESTESRVVLLSKLQKAIRFSSC